jgi:hypothetical protein
MHLARDRDMHAENAEFVLADLGEQFNHSQLEVQLSRLLHNRETLLNVEGTIKQFRDIAERSYSVRFSPDSDISERVLWPLAAAEQNGMEDARCVRLNDANSPLFVATYTAFDVVASRPRIKRNHVFRLPRTLGRVGNDPSAATTVGNYSNGQ